VEKNGGAVTRIRGYVQRRKTKTRRGAGAEAVGRKIFESRRRGAILLKTRIVPLNTVRT